jgi:hypothetical protein
MHPMSKISLARQRAGTWPGASVEAKSVEATSVEAASVEALPIVVDEPYRDSYSSNKYIFHPDS